MCQFKQAAIQIVTHLKLPVFPLIARGKVPILNGGFKIATKDLGQISEWWDRHPNSNIGIPTGAASGFNVVDLDPRHGSDESLKILEAKFGSLPPTWVSLTGGGGKHICFKYGALSLKNRAGILPGIDVRGDGGYIVAPPSIHRSGKRYAWAEAFHPSRVPLALAPPALIEFILMGSEPKSPQAEKLEGLSPDWIKRICTSLGEGERNQTLTSLIGSLLSKKISAHLSLKLTHAYNRVFCKPPLPDAEIRKLVESIAGKELQRRRSNRT